MPSMQFALFLSNKLHFVAAHLGKNDGKALSKQHKLFMSNICTVDATHLRPANVNSFWKPFGSPKWEEPSNWTAWKFTHLTVLQETWTTVRRSRLVILSDIYMFSLAVKCKPVLLSRALWRLQLFHTLDGSCTHFLQNHMTKPGQFWGQIITDLGRQMLGKIMFCLLGILLVRKGIMAAQSKRPVGPSHLPLSCKTLSHEPKWCWANTGSTVDPASIKTGAEKPPLCQPGLVSVT